MRHRSKVWWCLALLLLPLAQAELVTRITLTDAGALEETDLGILGVLFRLTARWCFCTAWRATST